MAYQYFYMASYMIFRAQGEVKNELIKSGLYLCADNQKISLPRLYSKVKEFCGSGIVPDKIEVLLVNAQMISQEDYNSFLPDGMTDTISPEFDSHTIF